MRHGLEPLPQRGQHPVRLVALAVHQPVDAAWSRSRSGVNSSATRAAANTDPATSPGAPSERASPVRHGQVQGQKARGQGGVHGRPVDDDVQTPQPEPQERDGQRERNQREAQRNAGGAGHVEHGRADAGAGQRRHRLAVGRRGAERALPIRRSRPAGTSGRVAFGRPGTRVWCSLTGCAGPLPAAARWSSPSPPGQAGDSTQLLALLAALRVPRLGPSRPRTRPDALRGDKAYSSRGHRAHLRARGITAVVPEPADQAGHRTKRGSRGGRPVGFDAEEYKQRGLSPCEVLLARAVIGWCNGALCSSARAPRCRSFAPLPPTLRRRSSADGHPGRPTEALGGEAGHRPPRRCGSGEQRGVRQGTERTDALVVPGGCAASRSEPFLCCEGRADGPAACRRVPSVAGWSLPAG